MKPGVRYGSSPKLNNANHALNCPAHQWGIGGRHKYNAGLLRFTMPVKYTDEHNEKDCTELFLILGKTPQKRYAKNISTIIQTLRLGEKGQDKVKTCDTKIAL